MGNVEEMVCDTPISPDLSSRGRKGNALENFFKYMGALEEMVSDILSSPSCPGSTSRK